MVCLKSVMLFLRTAVVSAGAPFLLSISGLPGFRPLPGSGFYVIEPADLAEEMRAKGKNVPESLLLEFRVSVSEIIRPNPERAYELLRTLSTTSPLDTSAAVFTNYAVASAMLKDPEHLHQARDLIAKAELLAEPLSTFPAMYGELRSMIRYNWAEIRRRLHSTRE